MCGYLLESTERIPGFAYDPVRLNEIHAMNIGPTIGQVTRATGVGEVLAGPLDSTQANNCTMHKLQ